MNKLFLFIGVFTLYSSAAIAGGEYIGKFEPHYWEGGFYMVPVDVQASNKPAVQQEISCD